MANKRRLYVINQLYDDQPGSLKTIRYTPDISKKDQYEIYAYFAKINGRSTGTWSAVNVNGEENPILLETNIPCIRSLIHCKNKLVPMLKIF